MKRLSGAEVLLPARAVAEAPDVLQVAVVPPVAVPQRAAEVPEPEAESPGVARQAEASPDEEPEAAEAWLAAPVAESPGAVPQAEASPDEEPEAAEAWLAEPEAESAAVVPQAEESPDEEPEAAESWLAVPVAE